MIWASHVDVVASGHAAIVVEDAAEDGQRHELAIPRRRLAEMGMGSPSIPMTSSSQRSRWQR